MSSLENIAKQLEKCIQHRGARGGGERSQIKENIMDHQRFSFRIVTLGLGAGVRGRGLVQRKQRPDLNTERA